MPRYDYLIVGAGAAGVITAYHLNSLGKKVLILEKRDSISGASSCAGAFLSPIMGKPNQLKSLINSSLIYALQFYKENFGDCLVQKGLLRLPEDIDDVERIKAYDFSDVRMEQRSPKELTFLSHDARALGGYFFNEGAIFDTESFFERAKRELDISFGESVTSFEQRGECVGVNGFEASRVIFAMGHECVPVELPYLDIRAISGTRIEIKSDTKMPYNIHKEISISTNRSSGSIAIGATSHKTEEINIEKDIKTLLDEAKMLVELKNVKLLASYIGTRASSSDYAPIVGALIDYQKMLQNYPNLVHGQKPKEIINIKNLYIINGFGARGFVYAPMCSKILVDFLEHGADIPDLVSVERRFFRWAKKSKNPSEKL